MMPSGMRWQAPLGGRERGLSGGLSAALDIVVAGPSRARAALTRVRRYCPSHDSGCAVLVWINQGGRKALNLAGECFTFFKQRNESQRYKK
jgi:hypothetical protein